MTHLVAFCALLFAKPSIWKQNLQNFIIYLEKRDAGLLTDKYIKSAKTRVARKFLQDNFVNMSTVHLILDIVSCMNFKLC